jgi:hypothetical protein
MTTFTDDFNRADSTNLGAGWVQVSGTWSIISNRLSSGSAGGTIILRAADTMATNDHAAQVTIAATAAVSHGVWCRGNATISQGYLWRNDGSNWTLFSVVGGSFTSIGSYAAAAVAGDVAKIQAVGSTIKGFVNGVERVSVVNTAVTTGTSVGLRAESVAALRFDDFTAADIVAGATGDAALPGAATLTATGQRAATGSTALAGTASLTSAGIRGTVGAAGLPAAAALTASGTIASNSAGTATASTTLTATGVRDTASGSELDAAVTLAAAGQTTAVGDATLTSDATLTTTGQRSTASPADLAATTLLAAQGHITHNGTAALAVTAAPTAGGVTGAPPATGAATLNTTGTLTAAGHRDTATGTSLAATTALTAAGTTTAALTAALATTATLTAGGTTLSTRDDIDVTVGAPYSPWTAGQPHAGIWSAQTSSAGGWEVGAPW